MNADRRAPTRWGRPRSPEPSGQCDLAPRSRTRARAGRSLRPPPLGRGTRVRDARPPRPAEQLGVERPWLAARRLGCLLWGGRGLSGIGGPARARLQSEQNACQGCGSDSGAQARAKSVHRVGSSWRALSPWPGGPRERRVSQPGVHNRVRQTWCWQADVRNIVSSSSPTRSPPGTRDAVRHRSLGQLSGSWLRRPYFALSALVARSQGTGMMNHCAYLGDPVEFVAEYTLDLSVHGVYPDAVQRAVGARPQRVRLRRDTPSPR